MHPRTRPAEVLVTWGVAVMPKRLIVCCDGTWNTADQAISGHLSPTNVTKLALSIAPEDAAGARQCVYYHSGVGTSRWERLSGGAFGVGLSRNVFDGVGHRRRSWHPGSWSPLAQADRDATQPPLGVPRRQAQLAYNRPQATRMRTYGVFQARTRNLGLP